MSGVDVLAVIDFEMDGWEHGSEPYENLRQARAAVSELMDTVDDYLNSLDTYGNQLVPINRNSASNQTMRAALARCKPAALSQPATQQGN